MFAAVVWSSCQGKVLARWQRRASLPHDSRPRGLSIVPPIACVLRSLLYVVSEHSPSEHWPFFWGRHSWKEWDGAFRASRDGQQKISGRPSA